MIACNCHQFSKGDSLTKELKKNRRKLRTKLNEYYFIEDLIQIGLASTKLEKCVKVYFKELGYNNVQHMTYKNKEDKREDIRIFVDDKLIVIEVSASGGCDAPKTVLAQLLVRMAKIKMEFKDLKVFGAIIINHDFKNEYKKRCKEPFKKMKDDAEANQVCLISTTNLVDSFLDIKNGKLTPKELTDKICSFGVFR